MTDYEITLKIRGKDYDVDALLMEKILKNLRKHLCVIKFRKADDTIRTMWCTLLPTFLPPPKEPEAAMTKRTQTSNPNIIRVWDIEAHDWRAFDMTRFRRLSIVEPE